MKVIEAIKELWQTKKFCEGALQEEKVGDPKKHRK